MIHPSNDSEARPPVELFTAEGLMEDETYRPISALAVFSLLVGMTTPLALVHQFFWFMPLVGFALAAVALWRLDRGGAAMLGRTAAQLAMAISLIMGLGAYTHASSNNFLLRREARAYAREWFNYMLHDEPHNAYQMLLDLSQRRGFGDHLWDEYRKIPIHRAGMEKFVNQPLPRILLNERERAEVRFYQPGKVTIGRMPDGRIADVITDQYAVTVDQDGKRVSCIFLLVVSRLTNPATRTGGWHIISVLSGTAAEDYLASR
jgi:hypothetical protein